jgi:hypothetical protein
MRREQDTVGMNLAVWLEFYVHQSAMPLQRCSCVDCDSAERSARILWYLLALPTDDVSAVAVFPMMQGMSIESTPAGLFTTRMCSSSYITDNGISSGSAAVPGGSGKDP